MATDLKFQMAIEFIKENLGRRDLSVALIARQVAVSRSVLYRMFQVYGGIACVIKQQRLDAMHDLLSTRDPRSLFAVAMTCGFVSAAHASRSFREAFGISPGAYRASCLKQSARVVHPAIVYNDLQRFIEEQRRWS